MKNTRAFASTCVALMILGGVSKADLILSSLASPNAGVSSNVRSNLWWDAEFTTDATPYTLDSVSLPMRPAGDTTSPISVSLWSDSASAPGAQLVTLTGNPTPSDGVFAYTPSAATNLAASTTYHVVVGTSGTGSYQWTNAFLGTFTTTGPGSAPDERSSSADMGSSWGAPFGGGHLFEVSGSPIPEPKAAILTLAGWIGVFFARRRPAAEIRSAGRTGSL